MPNNVTLVVDGVKLECNGPILAQRSEALRNLFAENRGKEIYLDEFTGMIEQVKDCIQLLYGAQVDVTLDNLQALMTFSVYYKVMSMYRLCVGWVKDNISLAKFEDFFRISYFVSRLDERGTHALDLCREIILMGEPTDNVKVLEGLAFQGDQIDVMVFFMDQALWKFTLPMVTKWIDSNEKVDLVLTKIESDPISYETVGSDFLSKLAASATVNGTIIKVNKYVTGTLKLSEQVNQTLQCDMSSANKKNEEYMKKMRDNSIAAGKKCDEFKARIRSLELQVQLSNRNADVMASDVVALKRNTEALKSENTILKKEAAKTKPHVAVLSQWIKDAGLGNLYPGYDKDPVVLLGMLVKMKEQKYLAFTALRSF